jgi:hypothetical protein
MCPSPGFPAGLVERSHSGPVNSFRPVSRSSAYCPRTSSCCSGVIMAFVTQLLDLRDQHLQERHAGVQLQLEYSINQLNRD